MNKKNYNITLDPDVGETLRKWAKEEVRSLSSYINIILTGFINSQRKEKETENENRPSRIQKGNKTTV